MQGYNNLSFMATSFGSHNARSIQDFKYIIVEMQRLMTFIHDTTQQLHARVNEQSLELQHTLEIVESIKNNRQRAKARNHNASIFPVSSKASEDISSPELLRHLHSDREFTYRLVMDNSVEFKTCLFRERNFKIQVNLVDRNSNRVLNQNGITLDIAFYTKEACPRLIEANNMEEEILSMAKTFTMLDGVCCLSKIKVRTVSCHYPSNMLFLVILPKSAPKGLGGSLNLIIPPEDIQPLIIDRVIIKSKPLPGKRAGS